MDHQKGVVHIGLQSLDYQAQVLGFLNAYQRDPTHRIIHGAMQEKVLIVLNACIAHADGTQRFKDVPKLVFAKGAESNPELS